VFCPNKTEESRVSSQQACPQHDILAAVTYCCYKDILQEVVLDKQQTDYKYRTLYADGQNVK